MNRIIIICISILLLGCNPGINPLKNINFENGTRLVFYNLPEDIYDTDSVSDFHEKYGDFYINDLDILDKIKHEWALEIVKDTLPISSFYRVNLLNGQKSSWEAIYNIGGSQLLTENQILGFDQKLIEKYSSSFRELESYVVICKNISDARLLDNELKKHDAFIGTNFEENPLYLYNGITTLSLPLNRDESDFRKIETSIENDLSKIDGIMISEFSASVDNDSIKVKVLSKDDISSNIQSNYKIIENL